MSVFFFLLVYVWYSISRFRFKIVETPWIVCLWSPQDDVEYHFSGVMYFFPSLRWGLLLVYPAFTVFFLFVVSFLKRVFWNGTHGLPIPRQAFHPDSTFLALWIIFTITPSFVVPMFSGFSHVKLFLILYFNLVLDYGFWEVFLQLYFPVLPLRCKVWILYFHILFLFCERITVNPP